MTQPGDDGRYEAPVERLAGARSSGRRGRAVAVLIILLVGGAIGLSVLPGDRQLPVSPTRSPDRAIANGHVAPSVDRLTGGSPGPMIRERVEALVALPDRAIDGAPRPILVTRRGVDATVSEWTTGLGLAVIRTFPGAFAGFDGVAVSPVLSPDADRLLILAGAAGDASTGDRGRLVDATGAILWEGDGASAGAGATWSPDGRVVVTASRGNWQVVSILPSGRAAVRLIRLPPEVVNLVPTPAGAGNPYALQPLAVPVGFSADGKWIYGAIVASRLGTVTGQFRAATGSAVVETVESFRVGRSDGLLPAAGTFGGRLVDPTSGAIANWRPSVDFSGGPNIEIRRRDGAFAFVVNAGTPLGSAWDGNGRLYVLASDAIVFPNRTELVRIGRRGAVEATLLQTGPVAGAALVGVRHGFAALLVAISRPVAGAQIVLVDLAEPGHSAAFPLTADQDSEILTASLLP